MVSKCQFQRQVRSLADLKAPSTSTTSSSLSATPLVLVSENLVNHKRMLQELLYSTFPIPAVSTRLLNVVIRLTYNDVTTCSRFIDLDAFGISIYDHLQLVLNAQWLASNGEGGLCGSVDSCRRTITVEATCNGGSGRRRKRQTNDANVVITIPSVEFVAKTPTNIRIKIYALLFFIIFYSRVLPQEHPHKRRRPQHHSKHLRHHHSRCSRHGWLRGQPC